MWAMACFVALFGRVKTHSTRTASLRCGRPVLGMMFVGRTCHVLVTLAREPVVVEVDTFDLLFPSALSTLSRVRRGHFRLSLK
jgi:hypothetical protein